MIVATYKDNTTVEMLRFIAGFALLFACAQITIPLNPVPITLQTMGVMIVALLYGMREGMQIVVSYVVAGSLGVPVFVEYSSGPHVLIGASGGYLIGFILCVYCMNKLKGILSLKSNIGLLLNCLVGTGIIYVCGITWLALGVKLGWGAAIVVGMMPFILPGVVKAMLLTACLRSLGVLGRN